MAGRSRWWELTIPAPVPPALNSSASASTTGYPRAPKCRTGSARLCPSPFRPAPVPLPDPAVRVTGNLTPAHQEPRVSEQSGDMRALIEQIAKALVDEPDHVSVSQADGEQTAVLELKVAPNDLGKVIGKQGRTACAMRTLLGAAGMKFHRRFTLEILE